LENLKNQKFALYMHVKHVMKITAKINTMQNIDIFAFSAFSVLNELKERLIAVRSDFQQDSAVDQCIKHLQACVRANGGHFSTFCEQTLANN